MKKTSTINPDEDLYRRVRAAFITQCDSFTGWCKREHINPTNGRAALVGFWKGPQARKLLTKILKASGVDSHQYRAA
jgi:hypothetical protein